MRKITAVIILTICIMLPLSAATEFGTLGFAGGYSTRGAGIAGFNSTYQYLGDLSRYFGIGLGTHEDVAFDFADNYLGFFVGFIAGPGFEIRPAENMTLNITVGPSVILEGPWEEAFGFGVGVDASYTYYFDGSYPQIGVTVGTTLYPQFLVFDDLDRNRNFLFAGTGYIGIAWRFPGYSWDQLTPPPLGYEVY